jgi:hypothetical protein
VMISKQVAGEFQRQFGFTDAYRPEEGMIQAVSRSDYIQADRIEDGTYAGNDVMLSAMG